MAGSIRKALVKRGLAESFGPAVVVIGHGGEVAGLVCVSDAVIGVYVDRRHEGVVADIAFERFDNVSDLVREVAAGVNDGIEGSATQAAKILVPICNEVLEIRV